MQQHIQQMQKELQFSQIQTITENIKAIENSLKNEEEKLEKLRSGQT